MQLRLLLCVPLVACTNAADSVVVQLAPEVISSIDGTVSVHAIVLAEREPVPEEPVEVSITYTDRNGMDHAIAPITGSTDQKGAFDATFEGLIWDGIGEVKVTVPGGGPEAAATFSVLDRTPPKVTIQAPANNQVRAGQDTNISVKATDEIGVSQVYLEWSGGQRRDRSGIIATGAGDVTLTFDFQAPDAPGTTLTLYALAEDLSGNQGVAMPITVNVVP